MKTFSRFVLLFVFALSLVGCSSNANSISGTYSIHIGGYDWGAGVDQVVLKLDEEIDSVASGDFIVTETKQTTDWNDSSYPIIETTVDRKIVDVYLSDENGDKVTESSMYVTLDLYVSPNEGNPLLYSMKTAFNSWSDPYYLNISLADNAQLKSNGKNINNISIDTKFTSKNTAADVFETSTFKATDNVEYKYSSYKPENDSDVLVVWLHGTGEGGTENTDSNITTLANKVTALADEEFQTKLGGANILVPQCPTSWMDPDGTDSRDENGSPLLIQNGTSFYLNSLKELIDSYKKECGAEKVVIAGASNGGFMTLLLATTYPDEFDAIVPIAEGFMDSKMTDEKLQAIKDLPMYFIYSYADTSLEAQKFSEGTINRLKAMGASNLHVSTSEKVIDTSGKYFDQDGLPYEYSGHWSWIYFDNNEANSNETGIDVFSWIAEQVK